MGATGRLALFLGIVLSVWTLFHVYAFQRAFSIPVLARAVPVAARVALFTLLWLSYPLGRVLAKWAAIVLSVVAPVLRRLSAPLGVYGVTGNHEFYAGLERRLCVFEAAGIRALRDGWVSGHTHGGQLWPFTYVSAIPYPFQAGRYEVEGMTLAVSRGIGTWGPPMRLFFRSEIVEVTLRT